MQYSGLGRHTVKAKCPGVDGLNGVRVIGNSVTEGKGRENFGPQGYYS